MAEITKKYPESGQMVFVRQRPAIVREVTAKSDPYSSEMNHLVDIEYIDG